MPQYWENTKTLQNYGYDWLLDTNIEGFKKRVADKLGFESNIMEGTGMLHNYRPAFGLLYENEIKGYDFWGHTDFDCVYGRVDKFISDNLLSQLDIHSNHHNYISGPWSLYRNIPKINTLFEGVPDYKGLMLDVRSNGWAEKEFTQVVDREAAAGNIKRLYTFWLSHTADDLTHLHWNKMNPRSLMDGDDEIMMCHFNRKKIYPL